MDVAIVVPNFNGRVLLEKQLPLLEKAWANPKNKISEVIVIDDASTDTSITFIKDNFPRVKVIKHRVNRGFSSSVNIGMRTAKSELIALLNSDVYPEADFIEKSFRHFENKNVLGVSLHEKGYGPSRGIFRNGFIEHNPGKEIEKVQDTFWVSGGSGIWRRDLWMALGGMDEKLLNPFYWEDIDLCYRAQKRGYKLLWEPTSVVEHKHESTIGKLPSGFVTRIKERNHLLFVWKNLTSKRLFRRHLIGLFRRVIFHPGYLIIVLMALGRISQVLRARKTEMKESKVSDEAIFQKFLRND